MTQVSGAISLDLNKVIRETARAVLESLLTRTAPEGKSTPLDEIGQAVGKALMFHIRQVGDQVEVLTEMVRAEAIRRDRLAGRVPLDPDDTVATLACHLPAYLCSQDEAVKVAKFQADRLTEAGYALVPIGGNALEAAQALELARTSALVQGPGGTPAPCYFEQGSKGVDIVNRAEAQALAEQDGAVDFRGDETVVTDAGKRADARLAEARRNGTDDSWFEEEV